MKPIAKVTKLGLAVAVIAGALGGCVAYPQSGYYNGGYGYYGAPGYYVAPPVAAVTIGGGGGHWDGGRWR